MKREPHVWVVEILSHGRRGRKAWEPVSGFGLSQDVAGNELTHWRRRFPGCEFRIAKYIRVGRKP